MARWPRGHELPPRARVGYAAHAQHCSRRTHAPPRRIGARRGPRCRRDGLDRGRPCRLPASRPFRRRGAGRRGIAHLRSGPWRHREQPRAQAGASPASSADGHRRGDRRSSCGRVSGQAARSPRSRWRRPASSTCGWRMPSWSAAWTRPGRPAVTSDGSAGDAPQAERGVRVRQPDRSPDGRQCPRRVRGRPAVPRPGGGRRRCHAGVLLQRLRAAGPGPGCLGRGAPGGRGAARGSLSGRLRGRPRGGAAGRDLGERHGCGRGS